MGTQTAPWLLHRHVPPFEMREAAFREVKEVPGMQLALQPFHGK